MKLWNSFKLLFVPKPIVLAKPLRQQVFLLRHLPNKELYQRLVADNPQWHPLWIRRAAASYLCEFRKEGSLPPNIPTLMRNYQCNEEDAKKIQTALMS